MANEREYLQRILAEYTHPDELTRNTHGRRLGISDCMMEEVLMDFEEGRMAVDTVVLIDSKNFAYANHYVHRFLSSKGRCTSVLFGCLNTLAGMAQRLPNTAFVFVWDGQGKTWRHRVSKGVYKGNRTEMHEEFIKANEQIPEFRERLQLCGFRQFCVNGFECDDLIGILTTYIIKNDLFKKVIIKSSDKDFYQLVTDRIGVMRSFDKKTGTHPILFAPEVEAEIEIAAKDWVKVKALTGEVTDNIPKIQSGLGPKTAIRMVQAGLDPSKENFKDLPVHVRCEFGVMFSKRWPLIRANYDLSHILRTYEDARIDDEKVRTELEGMVDGLSRESFLRDKHYLTESRYEEFTHWVVDYEMNELFGRRHELWKMP